MSECVRQCCGVDCVWNVMAHAQKPDLVFRGNGRVHLNRRGRQFSRLLAVEVCSPAVEMLDTQCSDVAWEYWLPTPFARFPFTSPPVFHRVPSSFNWTVPSLHDSHYTCTCTCTCVVWATVTIISICVHWSRWCQGQRRLAKHYWCNMRFQENCVTSQKEQALYVAWKISVEENKPK